MKFLRFKTRLLLSFWIVLIVSLLLPALYVYNALEQQIIETSTKEAFTQLDFIDWLAGQHPGFESNRELHQWCSTLKDKLGYRISIITPSGVVLADSAMDYGDIRFMDNHADRKEISGARNAEKMSTLRYSNTLQRELIYVAKQTRFESLDTPVILRLATPLSEIRNQLNAYAGKFWGFFILIFGLTMALSFYLARKLQQPVYQTIERVKGIGAGDFNHRYILDSGQEFYELSQAINETGDRISGQMQIITEQNQELEAILKNMREGVMLLDRKGRIKSMNPTLEDMVGCNASCIGKKPMEVFLNAEVQSACDNVIKENHEHSITLAQDNDTHHEVYLVSIPEGGILVVFHDISERRRLEKMRQDFVANVSHELKTPLTSIKGYLETLLTGRFSFQDEARSFLDTIFKNTNHMTNMVNDLLTLTRLQEKPIPRQRLLPVNAADCFESAWENCLPLSERKEVNLDNRLESYLPVKADENALIQVFGNLISNAIQYTPKGKTITVYAEVKEKEITFAVRDEGPGIALQHQSRIFERFYRVNKERSRQSGGTGLGLAICRNAVAGMGGRIRVESPPQDGSTGSVFFFTLNKPET